MRRRFWKETIHKLVLGNAGHQEKRLINQTFMAILSVSRILLVGGSAFTFLSQVDTISAQDFSSSNSWTRLAVPSASGQVAAYAHVTSIAGFLGQPNHWTTYVHTAYFPATGHGWNGVGFGWNQSAADDRIAFVDDAVLGVYYDYVPNGEALHFAVSTNKHRAGLTNVATVMRAEFALYTNSTQRFLLGPPYKVSMENLLGPATLRGYHDTNLLSGPHVFAPATLPSRFTGLAVEGTNVIVTMEFGTNMVARIAFNKSVVPVWATTNGASIGPIPTNCVFYFEPMGKRLVKKVIY